MGNDMRLVKFRMMIRDIYKDLGKIDLATSLSNDPTGHRAVWLATVYEFDKLNDYGKAIIEQVCKMTNEDGKEVGNSLRMQFVENCKDMEYRMKVAKAIVEYGNTGVKLFMDSYSKKLQFLFWSLMILAVDDTDKEEHLSLICDFARMLKVSDFEMMDMVQIIRAICNIEGDDKIQTERVNAEFKGVIKRYGIAIADGIEVTDGDDLFGLLGGTISGCLRGV